MTAQKAGLFGLALSLVVVCCAGCANDILDPSQIGRFRPVPVVNVILDSLGVADEPEATYIGAEPPRPEDLIDYERDYVFGPGDILRVSIYELRQEGLPFINDYIVTESGRVSIPDVGQIRAEGLTEVKLEEEIKDILSPGILKNPSVTVLLLQSEQRKFSIYGQGVATPGRFDLPRYTFRLTDAIALAGDVGQFNVSTIYVSRDVPTDASPAASGDEAGGLTSVEPSAVGGPHAETAELKPVEPAKESNPPRAEDEMLELIRPFGMNSRDDNPVIASAELVTEKELEAMASPASRAPQAPAGEAAAAPAPFVQPAGDTGSRDGDGTRIEWVFENGKWVPKQIGAPEPIEAADTGKATPAAEPALLTEPSAGEYGWPEVAGKTARTRVIRIPVDKLKSGDPAYDIIIRPGDRISIPVDIIGEFWVTGNVRNQGTINLTGRPMTLKMAIAAAGGLGDLAWPKKVEVVRRLGRNKSGLMQEEIVLVDLDKIAKGQQPDFFIKPYDLVNVGTHGTSRWLAELRNAFSAAYGFGFIYNRNFAYTDDFYGKGLF